MALVDNSTLRAAIAAFQQDAAQPTFIEVLRNCLQGELLLDISQSDFPEETPDDQRMTFTPGMQIAIAEAKGPDGGRALLSFTRQEEAAKLHETQTVPVRTLAQPAAATFEFAAAAGYQWLYIDPSGPTVAISLADIQRTLADPHNDAVKAALAVDETERRAAVITALLTEAPLFYAAETTEEGGARVRTIPGAQGPIVVVGTAPLEIFANHPDDSVAPVDIRRILDDVLQQDFAGILLNPAGPSLLLDPPDLLQVRGLLPEP